MPEPRPGIKASSGPGMSNLGGIAESIKIERSTLGTSCSRESWKRRKIRSVGLFALEAAKETCHDSVLISWVAVTRVKRFRSLFLASVRRHLSVVAFINDEEAPSGAARSIVVREEEWIYRKARDLFSAHL